MIARDQLVRDAKVADPFQILVAFTSADVPWIRDSSVFGSEIPGQRIEASPGK